MLLDHDHRHALVRHQPPDHAHQFLHDDRGQALHRLVEEQDARVGHQCPCNGQHLLLTTRQLIAHIRATFVQAREDLVDLRQVPWPRPFHHGQVFLDRQRREHVALLRHPAQPRARALIGRHARDVAAGPADRALVQLGQAHQRHEQTGLADAVAPQEGQAVALVHRKRHVFQHDRFAVAGGHAVQRKQFRHVRPPPDTLPSRADRPRFPRASLRSAPCRRPAP